HMSLLSFAHEYEALPPGEQHDFAEAVRHLLTEGMIWREDERDRRVYTFLTRRRDLVADYLMVAGWQLHHHERLGIFQVMHGEGAYRRRLNRKTTIWLLLLRLIYAEKRERMEVTLTRYPIVTVSALYQRYIDFFPGQRVREKTSLDEALRTLQSLKLIRSAGGGPLRAANSEQVIELLPTLEVIVPFNAIMTVAERLRQYSASPHDSDDEPDSDSC
ncbi:MAG: DUF4194 domain-containing protein, partial [Chloroflexaceae bacterium]|nr:DUF4194 domain-containing protein [Chloroflexaceae bacterium]